MVGRHGRRNEDFPGEEVLGLKGVGEVTPSQKVDESKRENGRGEKEQNTEILVNKISR